MSNGKSPSRKVNELDNRGSHFYLSLFWAEALANQTKDGDLKHEFAQVFKDLQAHEAKIVEELNSVQGHEVDLKGYYEPNEDLTSNAMRPSKTLNKIID